MLIIGIGKWRCYRSVHKFDWGDTVIFLLKWVVVVWLTTTGESSSHLIQYTTMHAAQKWYWTEIKHVDAPHTCAREVIQCDYQWERWTKPCHVNHHLWWWVNQYEENDGNFILKRKTSHAVGCHSKICTSTRNFISWSMVDLHPVFRHCKTCMPMPVEAIFGLISYVLVVSVSSIIAGYINPYGPRHILASVVIWPLELVWYTIVVVSAISFTRVSKTQASFTFKCWQPAWNHHSLCLSLKTGRCHDANFVTSDDKVGIISTLGFAVPFRSTPMMQVFTALLQS